MPNKDNPEREKLSEDGNFLFSGLFSIKTAKLIVEFEKHINNPFTLYNNPIDKGSGNSIIPYL